MHHKRNIFIPGTWDAGMGWITNFIHGRHSPSQSMINAYSRYTFVRRISPKHRESLLRADHEITSDWKNDEQVDAIVYTSSRLPRLYMYDGNSKKSTIFTKCVNCPSTRLPSDLFAGTCTTTCRRQILNQDV